MDGAVGMTGGGQEGASPCIVISMDDAAGMTGKEGQEGGPCATVPMDDAAVMIARRRMLGREFVIIPRQSVVHALSVCSWSQGRAGNAGMVII